MSKVSCLTDQTFKDAVKDGVVMVDFWAPWCGPCRSILPILDEIAEEYEEFPLKICKVNIDENPEIVKEFDIRTVPTFYVYKDGVKVGQATGSRTKYEIINLFNNLL